MRCPWCANPEGIPVVPHHGKQRKLLDSACPYGAVKDKELDRSRCEMPRQKVPSVGRGFGTYTVASDRSTDDIIQEAVKCKADVF